MDEKLETPNEIGRISLNRRTITRGIGWGVPAVMVLGATPAFAATGDTVAITDVAVYPAATGTITAPLVASRTINLATPATATVTVTGTATTGVQVYLTSGGYTSPAVTATGGNWSITIPATTVSAWSDGPHTFTAIVVTGNKPSATSDLSVVKDTVAPTVNATQATLSSNKKDVEISGTMSEAGTVVVTITSTPTLGPFTYSYPTSTQWAAASSTGENESYEGSVVATDRAGNTSIADTFSWLKGANSPITL